MLPPIVKFPAPLAPSWGQMLQMWSALPQHFGPPGGWGGGGGCWVGLGQGLTWSPTHGPHRLPCGTRLGGRTQVSGHKACRTVDHPRTLRWLSRAGDATVPVCMCPCVSEGGGGGLWPTCLLHCWSASAHVARGSVCLVLQAPAGRPESLTLSPPGEGGGGRSGLSPSTPMPRPLMHREAATWSHEAGQVGGAR